jgi:Rho GTPase-activating protein RGD1
MIDTQAIRQEYFNFQLPRILRVGGLPCLLSPKILRLFTQALKECADEIDLGTQYHLTRYAFLFESIVMSDGSTLVPPSDDGMSPSGFCATFSP